MNFGLRVLAHSLERSQQKGAKTGPGLPVQLSKSSNGSDPAESSRPMEEQQTKAVESRQVGVPSVRIPCQSTAACEI